MRAIFRTGRRKPGQLQMKLREKPRHGGRRKNAGRKSRFGLPRVARVRRSALVEQHPVHVTWRVLPHVWQLRSHRCFRVILRAFVPAASRLGVRITHFSVQMNHVHVIAEANGTKALTKAMQGLAIRMAKGLNKLMGRKGEVFADRYHAHPLGSPTEVRNAIAYVMNNARIHAQRQGRPVPQGEDDFAVGPAQVGNANALWRRLTDRGPPVAEPEGWMLIGGWRRGRQPPRAV